MPYNILLLPLVGGYYILLNFVYFKYKYQRLSSQRILFGSIVCAIFLITSTFALRAIINYILPDCIPNVFRFLDSLPIDHYPLLWTAICSFLIAVLGTNLLNLLLYWVKYFGRDSPVSYAVRKYGDELEYLFRDSAINGILIQFTLKNNKVYVGFAGYIPPPKETNYLKVTPLLSGYRDPVTKKIKFTTDYFEVIETYIALNPEDEISNMDIVVKQDEILTANIFDPKFYEIFNTATNVVDDSNLENQE